MKTNNKSLAAQFEAEVQSKAGAVDPDNSEDWDSLLLGWALGKGLSPGKSHAFVNYIRSETELG